MGSLALASRASCVGASLSSACLGLVEVLLRPQRVVVAHRLAPVGEGELRVGLLGLLERQRGLVELEVVQRLDAGEERLLCGAAPEVGKVIEPNCWVETGLDRANPRRQGHHRRHAHANHGQFLRKRPGCIHARPVDGS